MLTKTFYTSTLSIMILMSVILFSLPTPKRHASTNLNDEPSHASLVIKNANIFDGKTLLGMQDIEIKNGVIHQLAPDIKAENSSIIDASDKTIIPGLIDAHTHSFGDALDTTLSFGVTTHVDMFTPPSLIAEEQQKRLGRSQSSEADLFSAGMLATIAGGHGTQFGIQIDTINSPDDAADWVAKREQEGSNFIKLVYMPYSSFFKSIDRPTAAAIIKAAHKRKLTVVAHISSQRAAQELLEEGIDGFVHIFADEKVSNTFIELAKSNDIFVIPTLSVIAVAANKGLSQRLANDPLIQPYLRPDQRQQLLSGFSDQELPGFDLSIAIHNTQKLHQAGIRILAGSDASNPGTIYGASIHQELELLAEAGLTPEDALNAATSNVAKAFNLSNRGVIAEGFKADFVVLNSNPFTEITSTRDIDSVYKNGQLVERVAILPQHPTATLSNAALSDFSKGLTTASNFVWSKTDDTMVSGKSSASMQRKDNHLTIESKVNPGFMFPWAGAGAFTRQAVDISTYTQLQFRVRGSSGQYQAMMFSGAQAGAPPSQTFEVNEQWNTISLELKRFRGLDSKRFNGLAIVAGPSFGEFKYQLDSVKLIR